MSKISNKNHWIALYLSGQYPGSYRMPNRLEVLMKVRQLDTANFGDVTIGLLKDKGDSEFYYSLLETFESSHSSEEYSQLLERIGIPDDVKVDPLRNGRIPTPFKIKALEKYLQSVKETPFSIEVVLPILQAMGYENVTYKGTVKETDLGVDFHVLKFQSPGSITHYTGVQVKAEPLTPGDTTKKGEALNHLIAQVKTAFSQSHRITTGEKVTISEMLVFNARLVQSSARDKFFDDKELKGRPINFVDQQGVLSLLASLEFKKDFLTVLTEKNKGA